MIEQLRLQTAIGHCERAITLCQGNSVMELHREIYATCLEALNAQREENFTYFGYNITDIAIVAEMVKKHGLTIDDVKKAVDNFAFAASLMKTVISAEIANEVEKVTRFRCYGDCDQVHPPIMPINEARSNAKKCADLENRSGRVVTFFRYDPKDFHLLDGIDEIEEGYNQNGKSDT